MPGRQSAAIAAAIARVPMSLPLSTLSWRTALAALAWGCSEAVALLRCRLRAPRTR
jgi:hypothetical protein